jgi:hypothetical protein
VKKSAIARESARLSNEEIAADGMVPLSEAMRLLGVGKTTVYAMLGAGDVIGGLNRGKRVVARRSIDRYNASRLIRSDRAS